MFPTVTFRYDRVIYTQTLKFGAIAKSVCTCRYCCVLRKPVWDTHLLAQISITRAIKLRDVCNHLVWRLSNFSCVFRAKFGPWGRRSIDNGPIVVVRVVFVRVSNKRNTNNKYKTLVSNENTSKGTIYLRTRGRRFKSIV